ncbi:hypothetical protein A1Q1_05179 [Trichosporon asahii var. asahii CBS 2479]|uniref:Uncharacterized protein n=1 Tax=Trichosporon asahii var. asahii (strain ATCC 90039 / CBS 2479 / JCM 2466 / KCTC 7840 / NBRC 103889/ NCYC 2677 / UAMH 7654) TaxID=1186058 RepID=J6ETX0_TRIAS|nr:hypothetical protein A1Q1_05179 [Trichosporon asahii var. asahii CBS 2479]EJT46222.1 hypothetical protein A1Q1_05179 [Trichosporon asahii var. asahii CBS 2479]
MTLTTEPNTASPSTVEGGAPFPAAQTGEPATKPDEEDKPLTAADVTTPAELALLKDTYDELEAAREAASEKEQAERKERQAQPGYDSDEEFRYIVSSDRESWRLSMKIVAMRLPDPEPLKWALVELSADFKRAHSNRKLAKFKIAPGREWYNDRYDLITRLEVYILMRFGASKKVNEDGIASYMSLESLHNLWTMCRHLVSRGAVSMLKQINYYGSLDRSGKGQATQAFKDRIAAKYKLKSRKSLTLPGISDLPPWTKYWDTFPEGRTLRGFCEFDLRSDITGGDSKTATVNDGILVINVGGGGPLLTWEPKSQA